MEHEPEAKRPRGLWDLMRHETDSASREDAAEPPEREKVEPETEETEETSTSGKGLWAMMGVAPPPAESPAEDALEEIEEIDEDESAPPPAWFQAKAEPIDEDSEWEEIVDETPPEDEAALEPAVRRRIAVPFVVAHEESPAQAKREAIQVQIGRSRGAILSLLVGLFAIPLTLLAARPEVWTRIPATVLGFGAMVLGLISFNEIQRSRGRQTGTRFAMAGMVLGTIAMFLGPLVVAPWSVKQTKASGRQITRDHLAEIGSALRAYHRKEGRYPPGETYRVSETGESVRLHSWMTELLPYLDAQSIYQDIRQDEPWNDPVNQPAMRKSVSAFLAGGVEKTHSQQGYGLSHFAGLGGQEQVQGGRMANVGIFDRSSHVTMKDLESGDGLSQTLIAGEIPENYSPWGEPGNWRTIGEGLNRDKHSFGNADRTGAMFLKADGSVQFFSNNVSVDVLKRLSTRDGEDNRMIPDKYR